MYYSLYNLSVESQVNLSNFGVKALANPNTDSSVILYFIKDKNIQSLKYINHQTSHNDSYSYYYVEDIALYEVYDGKRIVIRYANEIDNDLMHTLLNYPFAILFKQRNQYVIHASAVLYNEKVFCFCGQTQSGKSSIASQLIKNGGKLISEDTCVFNYKNEELFLIPSYNFLKISDAVNEYDNDTFSNPIKFKKKSLDRHGYVLDSNKFYSKPKKVDYFIYLEWTEKDESLDQLNLRDSLEMLLSNEFISFCNKSAANDFKSALLLVDKCKHYKYTRKKELKSLKNFIKIASRI